MVAKYHNLPQSKYLPLYEDLIGKNNPNFTLFLILFYQVVMLVSVAQAFDNH